MSTNQWVMTPWRNIVLLNVVFIYQAVYGRDAYITGYAGQSVLLKSGVNQTWVLTRVQWSIYANTTFIANLRDGRVFIDRFWRYLGRLDLNSTTGDLTIKDLRKDDSLIYTVVLVNSHGSRKESRVHLTVQEQLKKPDIRTPFSYLKDGQCHIELKCIPYGENVTLSWIPVGGFNGSYISGSSNSIESILWMSFSGNRNVTFSCIASTGKQNKTNQITVGCTEETHTCEVCSSFRSCATKVLVAIVFTAVVVCLLCIFRGPIKTLCNIAVDSTKVS